MMRLNVTEAGNGGGQTVPHAKSRPKSNVRTAVTHSEPKASSKPRAKKVLRINLGNLAADS